MPRDSDALLAVQEVMDRHRPGSSDRRHPVRIRMAPESTSPATGGHRRPGQANSPVRGRRPLEPAEGGADDALNGLRLLTLHEVAVALGFSDAKVKHLHQRGHLPTVRVGHRVYVAERDLVNLTRPGLESFAGRLPSAEPPRRLEFTPRRPRGGA